MRYLLAQEMDVYVIHVLSAEEIDPDLQGDLRLVDCEDGDVAEITVSGPLLEALQADAGRLRRRRRASSAPPRHDLPAGAEPGAGRAVGRRLPAAARAGALMLPTLINMLTWWQWLILAAVPPAIVLLYFLKLKRRPLEVPSTYLWHKSIEDLHVNSIWQRLRRNLLLFLQLLLVVLVHAGTVLRPGLAGGRRWPATASSS